MKQTRRWSLLGSAHGTHKKRPLVPCSTIARRRFEEGVSRRSGGADIQGVYSGLYRGLRFDRGTIFTPVTQTEPSFRSVSIAHSRRDSRRQTRQWLQFGDKISLDGARRGRERHCSDRLLKRWRWRLPGAVRMQVALGRARHRRSSYSAVSRLHIVRKGARKQARSALADQRKSQKHKKTAEDNAAEAHKQTVEAKRNADTKECKEAHRRSSYMLLVVAIWFGRDARKKPECFNKHNGNPGAEEDCRG